MITFDPATWDQPAGDVVSCGNRRDVPKRQRRHVWADAGPDVRHQFSGYVQEVQIRICLVCGKDDER
jgi:hypothetical protein